MQQLNFSTISGSQNVEVKDSIAAILPSPLKDEFSQHIELHLAKNKDISETENKEFDAVITPKQTSSDNSESNQKIIKTESQVDNIQNNVNALSDEELSASDTQKIAANGNDSEMMTNGSLTDEANQSASESELLMSFFSKVDKTLTEQGLVEKAPVDKILIDKNLTETASIVKNVENTDV
ncbi:hypothetical protein L3081_15940 [Colwellia sp. MSW7]|uniref:Flagellar hook-length control protein FliK n=1 Tax=Colwellia maritima TaxID=2912588 RepID=A0ABS9X2Z6_9GAMM|nr:hypothetical protein [Colwellia maritima]MCI2284609.1 hypothetical protein [Colwellia maritima]